VGGFWSNLLNRRLRLLLSLGMWATRWTTC
jgi:hypothetical protein